MGTLRRVLPLAGWVAALLGLLAGLAAAGEALPSPPLTEPGAWPAWIASQPPVPAVFGLLRLVALAVGFYLLATTLLVTVARLARAARMIRVADALTVPAVRRLTATAVGVGLATATLSGLSEDGGPWAGGGPTTITAEMAEPGEAGLGMASLGEAGADEVTLALRDDADDGEGDGGDGADPERSEAGGAPGTVVVAAGDHLWGIAERVVAASVGGHPSEEAVAPYWRRLVEANRDRLADPANPDLIHPGQEFVLPELDAVD